VPKPDFGSTIARPRAAVSSAESAAADGAFPLACAPPQAGQVGIACATSVGLIATSEVPVAVGTAMVSNIKHRGIRSILNVLDCLQTLTDSMSSNSTLPSDDAEDLQDFVEVESPKKRKFEE
jgi:hypothetical protein